MTGDSLRLTVERGDLVVPNMSDCFPMTDNMEDMSEEERTMYWQQAMNQGLGSRLIPKHFTTVGKMKVMVVCVHAKSGLNKIRNLFKVKLYTIRS